MIPVDGPGLPRVLGEQVEYLAGGGAAAVSEGVGAELAAGGWHREAGRVVSGGSGGAAGGEGKSGSEESDGASGVHDAGAYAR